MGQLFHLIYVQSLSSLTILTFGVLLVWWWVRHPLWVRGNCPGIWRGTALLLLLIWIAAVGYVTLLNRGEGEGMAILTPFWSYRAALAPGGNLELLRSNFMNVLLFLPGGLLLGELASRHWRWRTVLLALLVSAVLSGGIETLQGLYRLGIAETDDVIHNTLGGLLGSLPAAMPRWTPAKRQKK